MSNTVITFGIFILQRSRWHVFPSSSKHLFLYLYIHCWLLLLLLLLLYLLKHDNLSFTDALNVYYCFLYKLLVFDYYRLKKRFFFFHTFSPQLLFCFKIILCVSVYFNFHFQMNIQIEINLVHLSLFITLFTIFPYTVFNFFFFFIHSIYHSLARSLSFSIVNIIIGCVERSMFIIRWFYKIYLAFSTIRINFKCSSTLNKFHHN